MTTEPHRNKAQRHEPQRAQRKRKLVLMGNGFVTLAICVVCMMSGGLAGLSGCSRLCGSWASSSGRVGAQRAQKRQHVIEVAIAQLVRPETRHQRFGIPPDLAKI